MARVIAQLAPLIYLLTVPAGAYVYLSKETGYPTKAGGALVAILTLIGMVFVVVALRTESARRTVTSPKPKEPANDKTPIDNR